MGKWDNKSSLPTISLALLFVVKYNAKFGMRFRDSKETKQQ